MTPTLVSTVTLFTLFAFALAAPGEERNAARRHHVLAERMARTEQSKRDDTTQYQLFGCVSEGSPAILTHQASWDQLSLSSCVQACATETSIPYVFAGIIRGSECWCDGTDSASYNAIKAELNIVDQSNCQDTCVGSGGEAQWCGGDSAYQLYYLPPNDATTATTSSSSSSSSDNSGEIDTATPTPADTTTPVSVADSTTPSPTPSDASIPPNIWTNEGVAYNYLGCFGDNVDSRVLRALFAQSTTNTPASCATYCFDQGYPFAGLEFGDECFCGATAFADLSSSIDGCSQPCSGDASLACGAASQLAIYTIGDPSQIYVPSPLPSSSSGWTHQGCYIDDTTNRVLASFQPIDIATFSVDTCTAVCSTGGYKYSGVEVGGECYCGYDAPASWLQADSHDCDYPCPVGGGSCGGLLRLDVYASA